MSRTYPLDDILLPMGGTTVKDANKMEQLWESPEYIAEEKYDGSRYWSIGGRFFSRRVSVVDKLPVEKTDNIPHLHNYLKHYPKLILDGEIYIEGATSNEVTSIMGAKPEKAITRQEKRGLLNYVVFDILRDFEGTLLVDKPWKERRKILEEVMEVIFKDRPSADVHITLSNYVLEDKRTFCADIMARGGEGVMLKNINGLYYPGKKPRWNWVKVKQELTDDVVIMGYKPPVRLYTGKELETWQYWEHLDKEFDGEIVTITGSDSQKYGLDKNGIVRYVRICGERPIHTIQVDEGIDIPHPDFEPVTKFHFYDWIGAVTFGKYDENKELVELGDCSGITEALRADMSLRPNAYIGQVMEISAMQRTNDGYYRHPQFKRLRDDKNATDCKLGEM
ncbi:RNA ligase family protein [Pseudobacillus badius]|uniref:ATP-dependent DNA ligase n=1 Tax=Bacillus badius TaxID=1455 RepID=UPI0007B32CA6|nr:RNA ligase family protein [Bacillus badius]KZR57894.1 hypothetical protein A3781_19145 [Bacillus badius]